MEDERSIILQKKTILFLSLIIGALFGVIYTREINVNETEVYVSSVEYEAIEDVAEDFKDEDEIISKNVKYLMAEVISENVSNFAGDVTNLVENKESVANLESTEEIVANIDDEIETKEEVIEVNLEESLFVEQTLEEKNIITETSDNANKSEKIKIEDSSETILEKNTEKPKTVRDRDLAENNPPTEYKKVVEASATAYCLCKKCCGKSPDHPYYGYTHSGIKIEKGSGIKVIAVDPKIIPLNSKVYVEGLYGAWDYGHAIAADTGSAIKELKIDLYMDTHEEALQWGRKKVKVYLLGE